MKKTILILVAVTLLCCIQVHARLCTAIVNGGDWSSSGTWSCGTAPGSNDTMWIPAGFTVHVDINSPTYANMLVIVDGTLDFGQGQKINICPGGVYVGPTGQLSGGTPGSKINICGSTVWNGPGPTYGTLNLGDVVLPVELVSFAATLQPEGNVFLQWSASSETNNSHFTIEHSTNGLTFTEIGQVAGGGTTSQLSNYSFSHASPQSGTNYYRLKQTDYNGHYEYLDIAAVDVIKNEKGCVLSVYPNPCYGMCTVNFSDCPDDSNGYVTLQLIDANGHIVMQQVPQRSAEGGFTAYIDAENNIKPGVYIVRAVTAKNVYTQNAVIK